MDQFDRQEVYSTNEISKILGFHVSVRFLKARGIEPVADLKKTYAVYWRKRDLPLICNSLAIYLATLANEHMADRVRITI